MDGALFAFAMSFVSLQTVLPVFVKKMGGSNVAVGLIPVLWTIGFNFPQILIVNYAQRAPLKKKLMLKTALAQRIPWLLLAIASYFLVTEEGSDISQILFFVLFTLAAVGGSINLPVWFDLIAKITPVHMRGRLFAVRSIAGSILGILGGWVVKIVLDTVPYPENFALLVMLAFSMMMMSYIFLLSLKEEVEVSGKVKLVHGDYLRRLPTILGRERNYRNFLVADALIITATMAHAFFAVNAIEKFSLSDAYAGTFTIVMMASMIVGSLFFGYLADHFGHRLNLLISAVSTAIASLVALLASGVELYLVVFVGSAITVGLGGISRLSLIAELCSEGERPTYIALANMITSPFVLSGILAGWIANYLGYNGVFSIAGVFALASAIWLMTMVEEPRKRGLRPYMETMETTP